jgi:hypothetical protein
MGGACSEYGERKDVYRVLVEKLKERNHLGDPGIDGRIITRCIFRKWVTAIWTGPSWFRIGTDGGLL